MSERQLTGFRPYALLVVLCAILYLPGIAAIPPLDRDEARFAQATRQMLETGDFLDIRFQDEARNRKPAGIYWLQAASVAAFSTPQGTAIWPYRLPSLAGATAAVLLTFALGAAGLREAGYPEPRRTAFVAAVLIACALGTVAEAHIAKTDAALLAAIVAGQGCLGLAYLRDRAGRGVPIGVAVGFWAAETAAIYLKGPIGPGLAVATMAGLCIGDRDWRWLARLRPLPGIAATAALLAPWLIAIQTATAGRFLAESLGHDFLAKLGGGQEAHGAPPLYYAALSLVTFWPGSLLLVPAGLRGWRNRSAPPERFLLAWLAPAWLALELVPTKLPHYALPLYPAVALLAALALIHGDVRQIGPWLRRVDLVVRGLWGLVGAALVVALIALPPRFGAGVPGVGIVGAAAVLGAAALLWRRPAPLHIAAAAGVVAIAVGVVAPGLDRVWLSRSAALLVAAHAQRVTPPLVAVGYNEPSLVFLIGTRLRLAAPDPAAALLTHGGAALVADRDDPAFRQAAAARGLAATALGSVSGLDYSNGRSMVLTLYAVEPG
jgi:4-amino-4-deoxy-L-arabinose transferase-like glycosyltransferase